MTLSHDEEEKHNHLPLRENCQGLMEASQKKIRSVIKKKLMKKTDLDGSEQSIVHISAS